MTLRERIARLRVFKRLAANEEFIETSARTHAASVVQHKATDKRLTALTNVVLAHVTCYRCGAMHHRSVSQRMKSPGGREVIVCLWCISLPSSRGYDVVKKEVIEA